MAWCRRGDKPSSEPMVVNLLTHTSLGLNELTRFRTRSQRISLKQKWRHFQLLVPKWQLSVQPEMKMSSKWCNFRFQQSSRWRHSQVKKILAKCRHFHFSVGLKISLIFVHSLKVLSIAAIRPFRNYGRKMTVWLLFSVQGTNWGRVTHKCVSKPTIIAQIMACRLVGAKPLSEPMLEYC